ncbi:Zona pellucida-like domain, partial [Popillia japonica]
IRLVKIEVVFIGDTSGYLPIPSLRGRHPPQLEDEADWRLPIDTWDREYRRFRFNATKVQHIEAECQDDYMKIRIGFNGSFTGLVYSAGYAYDPDCMYINGTGRDYYEFYIQLNRCGTLGKNTHHEDSRKNPTKNFMWNTVTVQYNPLIEEEFDEHFKVTCEYGYDFWKTVTFPFLDVEVATGNPVVFTLTPPECYMEIRYGYGTSGNRVTGPVRVGDPLTLIIYMRSKYDGFDIIVNDCFAHNGATKKIQLIDEYGCPIDDKLISRFRGSWSESGVYETQVFAYMKTFRFTGSPALYIECDVRMCHGRCPTQPCHWRNIKTVKKRSIQQANATNTSLSENINLFQSLRVLQDGEKEEERNSSNIYANIPMDSNNVCMKTGWFSALLALGVGAVCLLGGALLVTCTKMKKTASDKITNIAQFQGYMTHKGRIN